MTQDGELYEEVDAILRAVGDRLGVPVRNAKLLRLHSNASFALPDEGLLIRIATNPAAFSRVAAAIEVTRWLACRRFPCVRPSDVEGQPFTERGRVVSVWRYVPTTSSLADSGTELGQILRFLHAQPDPPCPLGHFNDPFHSVASAIDEAPDVVPRTDRAWLQDRIADLRKQWDALVFPRTPGLIHGDAHVSNLIHTTSGQVILGDWDHVAIGPREWDLMQIHFIHRRFGSITRHDLDSFAAAYGWDIREWPGLATLIAIREITGLSAHIRTASDKAFTRKQLQYRLDTLRRRDATARWESPPS